MSPTVITDSEVAPDHPIGKMYERVLKDFGAKDIPNEELPAVVTGGITKLRASAQVQKAGKTHFTGKSSHSNPIWRLGRRKTTETLLDILHSKTYRPRLFYERNTTTTLMMMSSRRREERPSAGRARKSDSPRTLTKCYQGRDVRILSEDSTQLPTKVKN